MGGLRIRSCLLCMANDVQVSVKRMQSTNVDDVDIAEKIGATSYVF